MMRWAVLRVLAAFAFAALVVFLVGKVLFLPTPQDDRAGLARPGGAPPGGLQGSGGAPTREALSPPGIEGRTSSLDGTPLRGASLLLWKVIEPDGTLLENLLAEVLDVPYHDDDEAVGLKDPVAIQEQFPRPFNR